jgi:hypothetical protein
MMLTFHATDHISLVESHVMDTFLRGGACYVGFEINNSPVRKLLHTTVRMRIFGYCLVRVVVKGK